MYPSCSLVRSWLYSGSHSSWSARSSRAKVRGQGAAMPTCEPKVAGAREPQGVLGCLDLFQPPIRKVGLQPQHRAGAGGAMHASNQDLVRLAGGQPLDALWDTAEACVKQLVVGW